MARDAAQYPPVTRVFSGPRTSSWRFDSNNSTSPTPPPHPDDCVAAQCAHVRPLPSDANTVAIGGSVACCVGVDTGIDVAPLSPGAIAKGLTQTACEWGGDWGGGGGGRGARTMAPKQLREKQLHRDSWLFVPVLATAFCAMRTIAANPGSFGRPSHKPSSSLATCAALPAPS